MLHSDLWRAIDVLAAEHGLSVSGLARSAALDPTIFNLSKRRTASGRERWPTTETISRILRATGTSLQTFSNMVAGESVRGMSINKQDPTSPASPAWEFEIRSEEMCLPPGSCWQLTTSPRLDDCAYALKLLDESMEPILATGDVIIASPLAPIRPLDRVLIETAFAGLELEQFISRSDESVTTSSINHGRRISQYAGHEILRLHRVIWLSQ